MIGVNLTMFNRLKGGFILFPLLAVLFLGGFPLYITALILSFLGIKEVYHSFYLKSIYPLHIIGYLFTFSLFIINTFNVSYTYMIPISLLLIVIATIYILFYRRNIIDVAITALGIIYVAIPFQMIVMMHKQSPFQPNITFLIFLIAFSSDIFAYFSGKLFGKHKLIPHISPNKTIEGSLGAIFGTTLVVTLYSIIFGLNLNLLIPLSIIGSILAQLGDLFASSIKRYNGLKDFGNLIPGHGGIIDRFDSILFVSPMLFSAIILFY